MSASQPGTFNVQEFTDLGIPLVGGRLYTYVQGTTTQKTAYTDAAGTIPHTYTSDGLGGQYIALNTRGELPAPLYLVSGSYDLALKTAAGATVWTRRADPIQDAASVVQASLAAYIASLVSSIGASLVGFIQAGIGAVLRTIQDELRDTVKAKQFGVVADGTTDDSAAWQLAINAAAGRPIIAPVGTTVIATGLTYNTSGESPGLCIIGQGIGKTLFDNRVANGALLTLDGTGTPSNYALGAELSGFSIISTISPVSSRGVDLKGQWFTKFSRVKIKGLTSDGVRITNNNSDSDSTGFLEFDRCWIQACGGWGVNIPDPTISSNATSDILVSLSTIQNNTVGGLRVLGGHIKLQLSSISYNGIGFQVPYAAASGGPNLINVKLCEFDGNITYNLDLQNCIKAEIERCKFVYSANITSIRIGDGGAGTVTHVKCVDNFHRRDAGTVTLHAIASNAQFTDVFDSHIPSGTGVTEITDSGTATRYRSLGKTTKNAIGTTTLTGSGSYTPNLLTATYHRIVVNAVGAFTVNAPTGGVNDGLELVLDIYNASGGVITVTLANGIADSYQQAGYVDPANNKRKTCRFIYHATSARFLQVGSWSPDL